MSTSSEPSGAASQALTRILRNTCPSCSGSSILRTGCGGRVRRTVRRCDSRRARSPSRMSSHTASGSAGCRCTALGRPNSSRLVTILLSRSTSRRMRPTFFSTTGSSRARKRRSWAALEMPKSGLRSSCATPAATSPMASRRRLDSTRRTSQARSMATAVWAAITASTRSVSSMALSDSSGSAYSVSAPKTPSALTSGAVISSPLGVASRTTWLVARASSQARVRRSSISSGV